MHCKNLVLLFGAAAATALAERNLVSVYYNVDNFFELSWIERLIEKACEKTQWTFCDNIVPCPAPQVERVGVQLVVVTRGLFSSLADSWPAHLKPSTVLFHLSDESRKDHLALQSEYLRWKHVYRNYWSDDPGHIFQALQASSRMTWLPLGYSRTFWDATATCARGHDSTEQHQLSFLGNNRNNVARARLVREIELTLNVTVFGKVQTAIFSSMVGETCDYARAMQNSDYCINLPGESGECFRFYESVESNCIPVIIDKFSNSNYEALNRMQFTPLAQMAPGRNGEMDSPFVWVHTPADLEPYLHKSRAEIAAQKASVQDWWVNIKHKAATAVRRHACPLLTPP